VIPRFVISMLILAFGGATLCVLASATGFFAAGLLLLMLGAGGLSAAWVTYSSEGSAE
jgi:hypothetical protein